MKKAIILVCAAVLLSGLSACEEPRHHKQINKYVKTIKLTHMSDGSWARYDDSNDIWLWYYMNTNLVGVGPNPAGLSVGSTYTGTTFSSGGYWKSGSTPTASQRAGAIEEEEDVQTDAEGNPITEEELQEFQNEEQAVETEATGQNETDNGNGNDNGGGGDAGGDSGGGGGDGE